MTTSERGFEAWAIVEVFGHNTFAGQVSEQSIGGCNFVRVDVPELPAEDGRASAPGFTKLFGQGAIYAITPVTEELARQAVRSLRSKPVTVYMPPVDRRPALAEAYEPDDDDDAGEEITRENEDDDDWP